MRHTPGQFFIAIMENQWQAKLTDDKIVRLMEEYNQRKYRSGVKTAQQYRRAYNRGELPGQEGKPIYLVPRYTEHGHSYLVTVPKRTKGKK